MDRNYDNYRMPYVSMAERRRRAARKTAKINKFDRGISPVEIKGHKFTTTFWGDAWCKNLEAYSDYSNRLPRGRDYVRNGSVVDLKIGVGRVLALVSGTDLYTVDIRIKPLPKQRWADIKRQCTGRIGSLVELLQNSLSKSVMEIVTRKDDGLFPTSREITLSCSCPDWATMCKHVAAALYGIGILLDHSPELLFTLRGVDPTEMVENAMDQPMGTKKARKGRVIENDKLSSLFGVDIESEEASLDKDTAPAKTARKMRDTVKNQNPTASKSGTGKAPQ